MCLTPCAPHLQMARTQKNKATSYHLGRLKAQLAKLRTALQEPVPGSAAASKAGDGFEVSRYGDARIAMVGFPSVGKSSLLTRLTGTKSVAAAYEFTTLTCIPGVIHTRGARLQLLDLPGIIEGAAEGKGRGRQVIAVAKSADLILMVLDAAKNEVHKDILTRELEAVGIRLNRAAPDITIKRKKTGGVSFSSTVPLTHCDEKMVTSILHEYRIHSASVLFREDATQDEFIDALEGNRKYCRCLYVYNKIDQLSIEEVDALARQQDSVPVSCSLDLGCDHLVDRMWDAMQLRRVYTKKTGCKPDLSEPVMLSAARGGATVKAFASQLHADLPRMTRYALVWGLSSKHYPQRCGLTHLLADQDVVQIVKTKLTGDGTVKLSAAEKHEKERAQRKDKAPLKS